MDARVVARNDAALENLLRAQITDAANARLGGVPDEYGMFHAGSAGGLIETAAASWMTPQSKHRGAPEVLERIRLAAQFLERSQSAEGNIDLLTTNFNSPPDTGFVVHNVGTAAAIAKMYGGDEVVRALRPFLVKAAGGMTTGGIHTPNHRWGVSSALGPVNAGRDDDGRDPHAESSLGGVLGAGAGQRRVSGCGVHAAHRAVAGGGNRYR